jgi:hypothetical protein
MKTGKGATVHRIAFAVLVLIAAPAMCIPTLTGGRWAA